jgi:hypothetical protein
VVDILAFIILLAIAKIAGTEAGESKATIRKTREINEID